MEQLPAWAVAVCGWDSLEVPGRLLFQVPLWQLAMQWASAQSGRQPISLVDWVSAVWRMAQHLPRKPVAVGVC